MRKQIDVDILGVKAKLSERNANDVLDLAEFSMTKTMNGLMALKISAILINQSLSFWIEKHSFIKRFFLNRKLSTKKLMKLSPKEITEFAEMVNELENGKKKVVTEAVNQSDEKFQSV